MVFAELERDLDDVDAHFHNMLAGAAMISRLDVVLERFTEIPHGA